MIGMEWVSKVEVGLLGLLIIAQIDFVIGSFLPPTDQQMANGYIGYNNEQFKINLWSDYQVGETGEEYSFFKVQIFWEGHKNLAHISLFFDITYDQAMWLFLSYL